MEHEIARLELEMHRGYGALHKDVNELSTTIGKVVSRVVALEEGQKETRSILATHEEQRRTMHDKLNDKLDSLLTSVQNLSDTTDDNTNFIDKVKKYWVRLSFTTIGIAATLSSIYWIYIFLEKHGMVIIFEKASQ